MQVEFYNVKKKSKVKIDSDNITPVKYEKEAKDGSIRIRYALKAVDSDGTNLTKFCSQADYNKHL